MTNKIVSIIALCLVSALFSCTKQAEEQPVWIKGWKDTTPMNSPRAGTAAVTANGHIYVIGGFTGEKFMKSVEYAKINDDGSLGPWKEGPPLNEERSFADAAFYNGSIYIVGGGKGYFGKTLLRSVERAKVLPDGSLSPWVTEKNEMNMKRRCSKVAVLGNTIYSLGGFGGDLLNTVEHAEINDDGTTDEWLEEGEKLTVMRYISGVKKIGDVVYVVGGHHATEGVGITEVEWSKVADETGFQPWKETAPLKVNRYGLALAAHNKNLYALGGITGAEYLDSVETATADENGELSEWHFTTRLFPSRSMFQALIYKDWIYIIGGTNRDGYFNTVQYATFDEKGDIGFLGKSADLKEHEEKKKKLKEAAQAPLPNKGMVLQTIETKRYLYIEVSDNGLNKWLAAPQMKLEKGASIRYGEGVLMTNFYSKELKRSFPVVIFTGKIQVLDK